MGSWGHIAPEKEVSPALRPSFYAKMRTNPLVRLLGPAHRSPWRQSVCKLPQMEADACLASAHLTRGRKIRSRC
jgi:hypothetical protein